MKFPQTYQDNYGDDVTVSEEGTGVVFLTVSDSTFAENLENAAELTPASARALAKALKQAANVAEGKPAKKPKTPLTDNDGDVWHLCPNGFYSLTENNREAEFTRAKIVENYGPLK